MNNDSENPTQSRKERERARIRQDIVRAAAKAFLRSGLSEATMADIAREAGYTAPALYSYFKSKEEIVEQLLSGLVCSLEAIYDAPTDPNAPLCDRLELVLRRQIQIADERREEFLLLIDGRTHSFVRGPTPPNLDRGIRRLGQWFKREAKPGELGTLSEDEAAEFLFGIRFALICRRLHQDPQDPEKSATGSLSVEAAASRVVALFFHGVAGKVPPP